MRLRIDLAYDGSGFHGWARQPGLRTVQGDVESGLDTVLRTQGTQLTVAGRTDAGVHARGQVAHVDLDAEEPLERLLRRVNGVLAEDVRLRRLTLAPPGFDARFSPIWRRYVYRIVDRDEDVDPLNRETVVHWRRPLDLSVMNQAAETLLGEHDFASFCKKREGATTIRTLLELSWTRVDGVILGTVRADAFCHNMVRSLTGCLAAIGEGRRDPDWAAEVLARRTRDSAVGVVPAHGLTLEQVGYPPDDQLADQANASRVVRTLPDPAGAI